MDDKTGKPENEKPTNTKPSGAKPNKATGLKVGGKVGSKPAKAPIRKRYESTDQTRNFEKWVKKLQLENTFFFGSMIALDKKYSLKNLFIWAAFSLLFSILIFANFDYKLQVEDGEIATSSIKSPITFTFEDSKATNKKRYDARDQVLPVFRYDSSKSDLLLDNIYKAFTIYRRLMLGADGLSKSEVFAKKENFDQMINYKTSDRTFEWLVESKFSSKIGLSLRNVIENWSHGLLADNPEEHMLFGQDKISLVRTYGGESKEETTVNITKVKDIYRRTVLEKDIPASLNQFSSLEQNKILNLAFNLIQPNVFFDQALTQSRRNAAIRAVAPVAVVIEKNQTIVNEGAIVNDTHMRMLERIYELQSSDRRGLMPLGVALVLFIFILVSSNLISSLKNIERNLDYKVYVLFSIVSLSVIFWKVFLFIYDATLIDKFGSLVPPEVLMIATPLVLPALVAGLLTRSPYLLVVFVFFTSVSFSLLTEQSLASMVIATIANLAALRTIYFCTKRNDIYKAGFVSSVFVAIGSIAFMMVNRPDDFFNLSSWWMIFVAAFAGGFLSSLLTIALVPVFEYFSGVTSNLKLLDLASMSHPILQDLIVKAPGTYHHSMVVGSMCEAAAREIGANPLLNKVMGYFHDIGKMKHPLYFIENQRVGNNPHNHISPHLSKTIIVAHVKDGIEMALKANLGREIVDGIRQHHGTTLVTYFYNKACQQAEHPESVKEEEFMYPGPKPQFKESAILMLADSIEAAARSLDEPTPAKLDHLVESMVEKKFVAQQLDECNLNFEEVSLMKQSFYRILLGVYHHRVGYPGESNQKPGGEGSLKSMSPANKKANISKSANA